MESYAGKIIKKLNFEIYSFWIYNKTLNDQIFFVLGKASWR